MLSASPLWRTGKYLKIICERRKWGDLSESNWTAHIPASIWKENAYGESLFSGNIFLAPYYTNGMWLLQSCCASKRCREIKADGYTIMEEIEIRVRPTDDNRYIVLIIYDITDNKGDYLWYDAWSSLPCACKIRIWRISDTQTIRMYIGTGEQNHKCGARFIAYLYSLWSYKSKIVGHRWYKRRRCDNILIKRNWRRYNMDEKRFNPRRCRWVRREMYGLRQREAFLCKEMEDPPKDSKNVQTWRHIITTG